MANFNLADYETVDSRIHRFYEAHPNGRIITEIVELKRNDLGQMAQVIMKAEIYRDLADPVPSATGYAEEIVGSSPVNRTSALENCESSACGRGLANLGFSPKGQRPSREEMEKVSRAPKKTLSDTIAQVTPAVEKMEKVEQLKKEAYAKAKFYKLEAATADQFLMSFAGAKSFDKIDWYSVSLESKESWQKAVEAWRAKA
jgi:hypothetical protein